MYLDFFWRTGEAWEENQTEERHYLGMPTHSDP